jgi:hypothetical protein
MTNIMPCCGMAAAPNMAAAAAAALGEFHAAAGVAGVAGVAAEAEEEEAAGVAKEGKGFGGRFREEWRYEKRRRGNTGVVWALFE